MSTLVSPGVSTWIIDDSFYVPVLASTVPLFFVATGYGKTTYPTNSTLAVGTVESNVVRTVTSVKQMIDLYGVPTFKYDARGRAQHGDARNEYGIFALYQFLAGSGSRAYVVRADIDLQEQDKVTKVASTPSFTGSGSMGSVQGLIVNNNRPTVFNRYIVEAADLSGNLAYNVYELEDVTDRWIKITPTPVAAATSFSNGYIQFSGILSDTTKPLVRASGAIPGDYWVIDPNTLTEASFFGSGVGEINALQINFQTAFKESWTITFTSATTYTTTGSLTGVSFTGKVGMPYDNGKVKFTIDGVRYQSGDQIRFDITDVTSSGTLGTSDYARRQAIVTALQSTINNQQDVRSETFEYNLILCPGYHEVVDELLLLDRNIKDEAFVIADTPCNKDADQVVLWGKTSARQRSTQVAYYYPWALQSNLDGKDVVCAPSGVALATYAYSDSVSEVWFAPAGLRRGMTVGVSQVGYVSGLLGSATTFNELILNQGQRDALYEVGSDLNPIVFFPGRGIVVWGQKTSSPASSALDRVNVVRMLCLIKRTLRKASMVFVFEPNDQITRDNLKAMIDGNLSDILIKRGLYDFAVLCDGSNNTPTRIDRNELWCDVGVKPSRAAEFIYIPITVFSTGAKMPG